MTMLWERLPNPVTAEDDILRAIGPGDRVTIRDRFGYERTGVAVMRGPYGWVLNMGGRHGTPAVAEGRHIVKVKKARA